jgi:hypothetical protein
MTDAAWRLGPRTCTSTLASDGTAGIAAILDRRARTDLDVIAITITSGSMPRSRQRSPATAACAPRSLSAKR